MSSREEELLEYGSPEQHLAWMWVNPEAYEMASLDRLFDQETESEEQ